MRLRYIAPLLAVTLLAASCSSTEEAATAAPTPTAETSPTSSLDTVPEALQFTSTLVDGTAFDAATLAGGDVLFWFWAPT